MDAHTQKLRYFVAVAEELNFTRAAKRLFMAQPALSKRIRELEDVVGVRLLERNTRVVTLTPAGEIFLIGARHALAALDDAAARALRVGNTAPEELKIGFCPVAALELTGPILAEFRSRYPEVTVTLREFTIADSSAGLADDAVEVAFVRLPLSGIEFDYEALFTEPVIAVVAVGHALADRSEVTVAELLDEPLTIGETTDSSWRAFWLLEEFRTGRAPAAAVTTSSHTEEIELVAAGLACAITAAAIARYTPHPGVRYIPITDGPGSVVALAWRPRSAETGWVHRFVEVARLVRDREPALVAQIESGLTDVSTEPA